MDQSEGQTTRRGVSVTTRGTDGTDGNEMGGVLATDSPEQFEGLKLKKGLMEEGLKLWVLWCLFVSMVTLIHL